MASNPYFNRVTLANGTTLIDLTGDTVESGKMLAGATAHDKSGALVTGDIPTKTSDNLSASGKTVTVPAGYYANQATKDVADGIVTNNTTLPIGKTSSGTVNRGSYIKIGAGYHGEKYYLAQANSGTKAISNSGTTSVDGCANVSVPAGAASTPATGITANPSISVNSSTGLITATAGATKSVTPTVTEGYVKSGTSGTITVSGSSTFQMTVKAAATYNASTSDQEIAAGQFLTGKQTIRKVTTSGISAANIKKGAVVQVGDSGSATRIKNVTGTFTDASTVSSGQTAAGAGQILAGYSAWVNGAEVQGTWSLQNNVYPVGSLWATYDGTAVPSEVLGFGTWTKVSPIKATWNRLKQTTTWAEMSMDAPTVYVWERTA